MRTVTSPAGGQEVVYQSVNSLIDAMHLGSAGLPVGGFAYSQGLEQAHEDGLICDRDSAAHWIRDALVLVLARQDLPYWLACHRAAGLGRWSDLADLVQVLAALRETAEFRLESTQMGYSIMQLLQQWRPVGEGCAANRDDESNAGDESFGDDAQSTSEMHSELPHDLKKMLACNYTAAHATLSALRKLPATLGLAVYVWSWLEAQVMAALKIVPLGQRDGQWLLHQARQWIEQSVQIARETPLDQAGSAAFGLAILSARHETQYTRLFRS